jgi:hypothetical protein
MEVNIQTLNNLNTKIEKCTQIEEQLAHKDISTDKQTRKETNSKQAKTTDIKTLTH